MAYNKKNNSYKNLRYAYMIIALCLLVGCKANTSEFDGVWKQNTEASKINPYKPDNSSPKKIINGYTLVFNDEFNHEGPMLEKFWRAEEGFKRNHEAQWYQSQNGYCTGGRLVITAHKTRKSNPDYKENSTDWKKNREYAKYTSASFITKKPYHQKFDSVMMIMRAKLPLKNGDLDDYGVWPAFWTTGSGPWPHGGEIDIMEYYNGRLMANFAIKGNDGVQWFGNKKVNLANSFLSNILNGKAEGFKQDSNWLEKYHVWKLVGDGKNLSVYLDDVLLSKINLDIKNRDTSVRKFPFMGNTCNLWLNLAVGGDPHPNNEQLEMTSFPRTYEIDYVRIYNYGHE